MTATGNCKILSRNIYTALPSQPLKIQNQKFNLPIKPNRGALFILPCIRSVIISAALMLNRFHFRQNLMQNEC